MTGAAGFIGFHLCEQLLNKGYSVIGLDNINDYYDVRLKFDRLLQLGIEKRDSNHFLKTCESSKYPSQFKFIRLNLEDLDNLSLLFENHKFDVVCNLAAQAGVRYSVKNPQAYIDSNIQGFMNLMECCRQYNNKRLVFASSSSVYGNNNKVPFQESQNTDQPLSLYAATKKANELMAYSYSHLYGIQTIGLRFFTVYGPWGRPDMAMFLFTDAIFKRTPIKVFNNGMLSRDFTFINDAIKSIILTITKDSTKNENYQLYNIGNSSPVKLLDFIEAIENISGIKAKKKMLPMQEGDVNKTWADITSFSANYGNIAQTSIHIGVTEFVNWYKIHYKI